MERGGQGLKAKVHTGYECCCKADTWNERQREIRMKGTQDMQRATHETTLPESKGMQGDVCEFEQRFKVVSMHTCKCDRLVTLHRSRQIYIRNEPSCHFIEKENRVLG